MKQLTKQIKSWGKLFGFQQIGISDINLSSAEKYLDKWLANNYHGKMSYMQKHGLKRSHPEQLIPGTLNIISVRMDYWPDKDFEIEAILTNKNRAYIARYALGRDYHKLMRKRLQLLANKIQQEVDELSYRVFVDSAPVLEKAIAEKAGLGWIGKHTNLINQSAGSWFFLGEIYTNLPLEIDQATQEHCGSCTACIDICPTQAIVGPYQLDSRRCISYLTIELKDSIPEQFRSMLGNRIYGCDDCQAVCPWNKFAKPSVEKDFLARYSLDNISLLELFAWTEKEFLKNTEGSAIRRIGFNAWLRNIAVGLGNADYQAEIIEALQQRKNHPSELVREHVIWALAAQEEEKPMSL